ncbi:MAG: peptide-methionine (S)-S-oxide reductase MsrA [Gluconacetobacter diazotrophicus]|nr:peptide-methionine (S)-S-oxide reductase MsrA [Gluconacetobacter diazotrophicus]
MPAIAGQAAAGGAATGSSAVAMTPGDALLPAPAVDDAAASPKLQTAVFAGGCFWGVQGVFQHVRGVVGTTAGYDGGAASTAQYETVSTGETGHAESVKVVYDPSRISYGQLLRVFFSVALDPTQKGGQYPDQGSQYRSVVFTTTPDQARIARAYLAQLDAAHPFARPIATEVVPDHGFFPAEDYHQNYLDQHPNNGYIATFDRPKIDALQSRFPDRYLPAPNLAAATTGAKPG